MTPTPVLMKNRIGHCGSALPILLTWSWMPVLLLGELFDLFLEQFHSYEQSCYKHSCAFFVWTYVFNSF